MTTPKDLFKRQMQYLSDNSYNRISAEEVLALLTSDRDIPPKTVCITFDDGYKDNYLNAFPVLEKYKAKATIFITGNFVGKKRNQFGEYLSWQEIREMKRNGLLTFGSHSLSHRNLAQLKNDDLMVEITTAKKIIEDKIGAEIKTFAYPYGWHNAFNNKVIEIIKKEGFLCAFTGIFGANTKRTDLFRLRRIRVSWLDGINDFKKLLSGAYDWYCIYQKAISTWKKPA